MSNLNIQPLLARAAAQIKNNLKHEHHKQFFIFRKGTHTLAIIATSAFQKQWQINASGINPDYAWLLNKKSDPIFLTRDLNCLRYVQNAKGICLFCDMRIDARKFNFSVCYQHEAWVFYSDDCYLEASIELGRAIQHAGAKKVLVMPFSVARGDLS